jgi:hypothetical protein
MAFFHPNLLPAVVPELVESVPAGSKLMLVGPGMDGPLLPLLYRMHKEGRLHGDLLIVEPDDTAMYERGVLGKDWLINRRFPSPFRRYSIGKAIRAFFKICSILQFSNLETLGHLHHSRTIRVHGNSALTQSNW